MDQNNNDTGVGAGVQFQDEGQTSAQTSHSRTPKIIELVTKYSGGYVKNEKQANYVLLGFVVAAVIVSLFLVFGGDDNAVTPLPYGDTYKPSQ